MKRILTFGLAVMMIMGMSVAAHAENSASTSVGVMSKYVWRGIALSNGLALQPSVDVNIGSLNVNMWSNIDMDPMKTKESASYNETDLTIGYALPVEAADLSIGYIYYAVGNPSNDTQEIFLSMSKGFGPVTPYLNLNYDINVGSGLFAVLGADYSKDLNEKAALTAGASISYSMNNGMMLVDSAGKETSGLYNAEIGVSLDYTVSELVTISPMVRYTTSMSDDAKKAIKSLSYDGDTDSLVYGGVTISLGF